MLLRTMRFWFVHSGEVSLRQQIVTQVVLGIASGDIQPGERLPSTRAMAQRYGIHANTVSAAYQELEQLGRVESRKGSGVYVRTQQDRGALPPVSSSVNVEREMRHFVRAMRSVGVADSDLRIAFEQSIQATSLRHYTLVEPDAPLACIVLRELEDMGLSDVTWLTFDQLRANAAVKDCVLVLPSKLDATRAMLPDAEVEALTINSVPQSLLAQGEISAEALIGIASHWPGFLQIAQTMLLARGICAEAIVPRDANVSGWRNGLDACAAVLCDVVTADRLPRTVRPIVFRILSSAALQRHFVLHNGPEERHQS